MKAKEVKKNNATFSEDAKKKALSGVKKALADVLKMDGVTIKEHSNKYDALELDVLVDGATVLEVDIDNKPRQFKVVVCDDIHALIKDIVSNGYESFHNSWNLKHNYRFTTKEFARYGTFESLKDSATAFNTFLKAVNDTLVNAMETANNSTEESEVA